MASVSNGTITYDPELTNAEAIGFIAIFSIYIILLLVQVCLIIKHGQQLSEFLKFAKQTHIFIIVLVLRTFLLVSFSCLLLAVGFACLSSMFVCVARWLSLTLARSLACSPLYSVHAHKAAPTTHTYAFAQYDLHVSNVFL